MDIDTTQFCVPVGASIDLSTWATCVAPLYRSKSNYQAMLAQQINELSHLQEMHYAAARHSVLLIFQAMDAAGKDSTIRHVMSGVNPQGCQVYSFKHPSEAELTHDFLWRTTRDLPERGRIGIFNRSYYEEVLIVRVHPTMLLNQNLPKEALSTGQLWRDRYQSMNDLELHLSRNGTKVIKFFLHLSEEEQRQRFLRRIDEPTKNWKLSQADINERQHWQAYQHAYQECLSATSTSHAPWYAIPADDKENARLLVAAVVLQTLRALDLQYPILPPERIAELQNIREGLMQQAKN